METTKRIAGGVLVCRRLDGLTLQVQGVSPEQVSSLGFLLFFALVPVLSASMFGLTGLVARSESPTVFLAVGVSAIACVLAGRWTSHRLADLLGPLYWQTFTIQGHNLTVRSMFSERHIPLADILAFDPDGCLLVTADFRAVLLAPRQPPRVRRVLAGLIDEALAASRKGSRDDIPDSLERLRAATS